MLASLERLAGGLLVALLAAVVLLVVLAGAVLSLIGVGLPVVTGALLATRRLADLERQRLSRWHREIPPMGPPAPPRWWKPWLSAHPRDLVGRELGWLVWQATGGLVVGAIGVLLPLLAARDLTFPLWWRLVPRDLAGASLGFAVSGWPGALAVGLLGIGWAALAVALTPRLARLQAWPGSRLLVPTSAAELSERVAALTATRAAALQAHTAELRRIERALHDGAQSRLLAVTLHVGSARRRLATDPARAEESLALAQTAAEDALAELRAIVRGILPPALDRHDLAGALAALAAGCAVPCRVEARSVGALAASIEATAYHVVAEALTNVSRHSGASTAVVTLDREGDRLQLTIFDDGTGGADPALGTGLEGIRRRVEALDGSCALTSPPCGPTTVEVVLPCGS